MASWVIEGFLWPDRSAERRSGTAGGVAERLTGRIAHGARRARAVHAEAPLLVQVRDGNEKVLSSVIRGRDRFTGRATRRADQRSMIVDPAGKRRERASVDSVVRSRAAGGGKVPAQIDARRRLLQQEASRLAERRSKGHSVDHDSSRA